MHHHEPKYHTKKIYAFAIFKVKATIIFTTSSETLKLLQSKLV